MIEEIAGATSEPPRRRHLVVLSALPALVSLVLLVALVVPPPRVDAPQQAVSPAPSTSGRLIFMRTVGSDPLRNLPLDLSRSSVCPDGSPLTPPYYLAMDANTGRIFAAPFDDEPRFPVQLNLDAGTRKVTVRCATFVLPAVTGDMIGPSEFDER